MTQSPDSSVASRPSADLVKLAQSLGPGASEAGWQLLQQHEPLLRSILKNQAIDWVPGLGGAEDEEAEKAQYAMFKERLRRAGNAAYSEDMRQAGWLGMLEGLQRYDSRHGVSFGWFVRKRVEGAVQDAKREEAQIQEFLDGPAEPEPSPENPQAYQMMPSLRQSRATSIESVPEPNNTSSGEIEAAVQQFLDALPPRQRCVVELMYWGGMTQAEVARALGITPKAVNKLWKKACSKGRVALSAYARSSRVD